MALSERERRILEEIEDALERDDPKLARRVSGGRLRDGPSPEAAPEWLVHGRGHRRDSRPTGAGGRAGVRGGAG
ncbi:DUF3040 domain-containing protein [Nonomuraea ferruginea]